MAFDQLPPQGPIHPPEAEAYARRALELSQAAAGECNCKFDIRYGKDYYQSIDIYRPLVPAPDPLPVLLFAHGGGWTNGYKEWMGLLAPAVTRFPAIFISVSHRLAPEYRFPHPFEDCLAALAWVHENIRDHGGDPSRLFVGGHSSGGHLYALCALRRDALLRYDLAPNVINACFPVSSRFNMVFRDPPPGSLEHRHQSVLFRPGQDPLPASPMHQLEGNTVPFLLACGSRDIPSIIDNNQKMLAAMNALDCPVRLLVLEDHDHFDTAVKIRHPDSPWMSAVRSWMLDNAGMTLNH
jgi:arylformamidase